MMKRITAAAIVATVLTGTTVILGASAAEANPGCVTQAEFKKAKKGMKVKRVHGIFDTKGRRDVISHAGGYTFEIRSYKTCSPFGAVSVGYENGKLSTKSAVF